MALARRVKRRPRADRTAPSASREERPRATAKLTTWSALFLVAMALLCSASLSLWLWQQHGVVGASWRERAGTPIPAWVESEEPIVSVGLIADLQYADRPDGYRVGSRRHYRNSLRVLGSARESWIRSNVSDVVVLGDNVDRSCREADFGGDPSRALSEVLLGFDGLRPHFVLGNHDVESFIGPSRPHLLRALGLESPHYAFRPGAGLKLVVLDTYEVSTYSAGARGEEAMAVLGRKRETSGTAALKLKGPGNLRGLDRRFNALGGALGGNQTDWLRRELQESDRLGERVVVFSHVPVSPRAVSLRCGTLCLSWDHDEVLGLLREHGCVKAFFAGHDHAGGYHAEDLWGPRLRTGAAVAGERRILHHVTVEGVIETGSGVGAYATLDFYGSGVAIRGEGRVPSRFLAF